MLTVALVLAIAAILLATAALIVAHTWRVLGEDLAVRVDRLEHPNGGAWPTGPRREV
jgi:hypothetical protein